MHRLVWLALLAACPAPQTPSSKRNPLVEAAGSPGKIRKLMRGTVMNAGLWFDDAECSQKFSVASAIQENRMDDFARCLAKLQLAESSRVDPLPGVFVLTYPPGLEIEALVVEGDAGPHLQWIGYESRRDRPTGPPSVAPDVFEKLRLAGDRNGPLTPEVAAQIGDGFAWLDVCIDASGNVIEAQPRLCSTRKAGLAFRQVAAQWKFQPYTLHGEAQAVCSLLKLSYPPGETSSSELPIPQADDAILVLPKSLKLVVGDLFIEPDDVTKTAIMKAGVGRASAFVRLCIDTSGRVHDVKMIRRTGIDRYDAKIMSTVAAWVYAPYVEDGQAVPVCTAMRFIYTQN